MKTTFKKIAASVMAVTSLAVGMVGMSANAATSEEFTVSHVNYYGAPGSESRTAYVTIGHKAAGATATVSKCYNTDGSGTTGRTYFDCTTYPDMSRKTIYNIGTATLNPSIGNPATDVNIKYYVSAYTPQSSNVYWSFGKISKK